MSRVTGLIRLVRGLTEPDGSLCPKALTATSPDDRALFSKMRVILSPLETHYQSQDPRPVGTLPHFCNHCSGDGLCDVAGMGAVAMLLTFGLESICRTRAMFSGVSGCGG